MTTRSDTSFQINIADRVHYATGVLLDAEDFRAEQSYHRGSLARALLYLFGSGTVAGLRVDWQSPLAPDEDDAFPEGREERLVVQPGLAIDRLGRVIEVPRTWCLRLGVWYESRDASLLNQGFHGDPYHGVVADVFVRFAICERGKTPAFASGPFDALDAVQPSRLREAHQLHLLVRTEPEPPLPKHRWSDLPPDATVTDLQEAILDPQTWRDTDRDARGKLEKLPEHAEGQDVTDLFLARVTIPVDGPGAGGQPPQRSEGQDVLVDNRHRVFVHTPSALARLMKFALEPEPEPEPEP